MIENRVMSMCFIFILCQHPSVARPTMLELPQNSLPKNQIANGIAIWITSSFARS
jgi:hypothetical protein